MQDHLPQPAPEHRRSRREFPAARSPLHSGRAFIALCACLCGAVSAVGCDDPPPKANPFAAPSDTVQLPKLTETPKPQGPPDLTVDAEGPKVGWSRVLIEKSDGKERLAKELGEVKQYLDGKDVKLRVDRKAKLDWVMAMFAELEKQGVTSILVTTESRPEYPKELKFTPQGKKTDAPQCSLVATILDDRGTAVWRLSGGTAIKRRKGFAGPDLSTTAETFEQQARGCKESTNVFLTASEGVEWGLVYDLGASTRVLKKAKLDTYILLLKRPTAGRKVEF